MISIKIGDFYIDMNSTPLFIAEIGINHNGSIEDAKKLIDLAKSCNVPFVKFQKRDLELCIPEEVRNKGKETPWGNMTYFEYKKKIEFGKKEYEEIDKYCKEKDIAWSASVWDIPSLKFIEKFDVPFHKIPSALLTYKELHLEIIKTGKPIILSTGMSTENEITKAIKLYDKDYPLIILHTNSAYPAKDENLNLNYIKRLQKLFPTKIIGYSGHELGISASLIAATLGAKVIERHITLDRAMWGTDQSASIEYSGLRRLMRDLQKLRIWLGEEKKIISENEIQVKNKLRKYNTL